MGERPDRPEDVRRDPLDRPDALGEGGRDAYPLTDPAGTPEEARPVGPDPALGGGVGGGAVVDEEQENRAEIERTRAEIDRKSTRLNSSHANISYAVFCLKKK